jgi:hypothetical protein
MDVTDLEGIAFYHPYAIKDQDLDEDHPEVEDPGDDRGRWKEIALSERDWMDVREELEYRPHFHIIGAAPHVVGNEITKRVHEETDWIIHRITRPGNNVSIYGDKGLIRAVMYCLSHTGIYETPHQMRAMYRDCGTVLNKTITQEDCKTDHFKRLSKLHAPDVLGMAEETLMCQEKTLRYADEIDDDTDSAADVRARHHAAVDDRGSPSSPSLSSSIDVDSAAGAGGDRDVDLEDPEIDLDDPDTDTPDATIATTTDPFQEESDDDQERELVELKCEGRIVEIGDADEYLADRQLAPYADHVAELAREYRLVLLEDDPPPD